jgi:hypothetical protein
MESLSLSINKLYYGIATPHFLSNLESFHKQGIPSPSQDLRPQRFNEFQSQPMTNELLHIPIPERQPRHSLPQYHNFHLTLHNAMKGVTHESFEFCITFTTSL